jgi:hypothetical protein
MPCLVRLTDEDRKAMRCDKSTKWADAVVVGRDSDGSVHLYIPSHPKSKLRSVNPSRLRPRKEDEDEYNISTSKPEPSSIFVPHVRKNSLNLRRESDQVKKPTKRASQPPEMSPPSRRPRSLSPSPKLPTLDDDPMVMMMRKKRELFMMSLGRRRTSSSIRRRGGEDDCSDGDDNCSDDMMDIL